MKVGSVIPTGNATTKNKRRLSMSQIKTILSDGSCLYCDTLYDKQREEAGCTTCQSCEQVVNRLVAGLISEEKSCG